MDLLDHFAEAIEQSGHTVSRQETSIVVEPINLRIEVATPHRTDHDVNGQKSVVFSIEVRATHDEMFSESIKSCLAGIGRDEREAFSYAAGSWVSLVFWTIHEALLPSKTPESGVECVDLLTRNEDTGEEFAWKFYVGQLGAAGDFFPDESLDNLILVKRLLGSISSVALGKKMLWLSVFIAKPNKTETFGECLLNNNEWADGLKDLHLFASEWNDVVSYTALKQFLILRPCELSEIKNYEGLRAKLPPMKRRGLFRRWFDRKNLSN
ncbi:MAG TPA: DUF6348 family protein [Pyrinomonadaceae bacterium]